MKPLTGKLREQLKPGSLLYRRNIEGLVLVLGQNKDVEETFGLMFDIYIFEEGITDVYSLEPGLNWTVYQL